MRSANRSESPAKTSESSARPIAPWSGLSSAPCSDPSPRRSMWTTIRTIPWSEPCQWPTGSCAPAATDARLTHANDASARSAIEEKTTRTVGEHRIARASRIRRSPTTVNETTGRPADTLQQNRSRAAAIGDQAGCTEDAQSESWGLEDLLARAQVSRPGRMPDLLEGTCLRDRRSNEALRPAAPKDPFRSAVTRRLRRCPSCRPPARG
jgi:hypothetical protein